MKKVISIYMVLVGCFAVGQDFHLTQFESAHLRLNPALAGQDIRRGSDYRIANLYRSQWSKVSTKPFTTVYLGYDTKFKRRWGFGAHLINNQAGTPTFRTFNFMVSGCYDVMNDETKQHALTIGVQLGVMNRSFRSDDLVFDSQYSSTTGAFDPSSNSGENLATVGVYNINRFDAGLGLHYAYRPIYERYSPYIGFSVNHITLPNQSFLLAKEPTPMIWKLNFGSNFEINKSFEIRPSFLIMQQQKAKEYFMNVHSKYQFDDEDYDLRFLLGYRLRDAFIAGVGMRYKDFIGSVSYDINTSYLSNFTSGRGGIEIRIVYQGLIRSEGVKSIMK